MTLGRPVAHHRRAIFPLKQIRLSETVGWTGGGGRLGPGVTIGVERTILGRAE